MKRYIEAALLSIILLVILTGALFGQANVVVKERMVITVDKAEVRTDVPPINVRGQTLVPIRGVFNAFNADIGWFPRERRVYVRGADKVIWLQIGDAHAKVNDDIVDLQVPAMIYRGRTMVPLRFIAEALGSTVTWNPNDQTITIVTNATGTPQTPAAVGGSTVPEVAVPSDDDVDNSTY